MQLDEDFLINYLQLHNGMYDRNIKTTGASHHLSLCMNEFIYVCLSVCLPVCLAMVIGV